MWGGGSSFGSAQPASQQISQMPANRPIDSIVHHILDSQSRLARLASRREAAAGRDPAAALPVSPSRMTMAIRRT